MDLTTKLAGLTLEHPLMNAAGTCKIMENVHELVRSSTAAIVVGSGTMDARPGNSGNVYWAGHQYSLNSLGLPNPGYDYYQEHLPAMVSLAHRTGKALIFSAAGFQAQEYADLAGMAYQRGVDLVELNLGCPNIWEGQEQKRIVCFDPDRVDVILDLVEDEIGIGTDTTVGVKISPFSDPYQLAELAKALARSGVVSFVTSSNTFPNAFLFNEEGTSQITPGEGLAGMGGPALKPIALGQVRQLRAMLPERIQIIGVGGIQTGQDIKDYLKAGATAVQVGTTYLEQHRPVFERLLNEYLEVVE